MGKKHGPEEVIGKLREAEIVLAQGVWRPKNRPGAADEGPGERKPAASSCDLRPDARQVDLAGGCSGKLLSPARRRRCIDHVRSEL